MPSHAVLAHIAVLFFFFNHPSLSTGFLDSSVGKESACNAGDPIPGSGRSPGGGHGNPLKYSCPIKKTEHRRIDAFKLWCWRRLLRDPWTAKRSKWSILKEVNPKCSLEELVLKLQYFGYLLGRVNSLKKSLMLGEIAGRRRRG